MQARQPHNRWLARNRPVFILLSTLLMFLHRYCCKVFHCTCVDDDDDDGGDDDDGDDDDDGVCIFVIQTSFCVASKICLFAIYSSKPTHSMGRKYAIFCLYRVFFFPVYLLFCSHFLSLLLFLLLNSEFDYNYDTVVDIVVIGDAFISIKDCGCSTKNRF